MNYRKVIAGTIATAAILFSGLPGLQGQDDDLTSANRGRPVFTHFNGLQNMGAAINAPEMDQSPAPAPNGLSFYFTSSRLSGASAGTISGFRRGLR